MPGNQDSIIRHRNFWIGFTAGVFVLLLALFLWMSIGMPAADRDGRMGGMMRDGTEGRGPMMDGMMGSDGMMDSGDMMDSTMAAVAMMGDMPMGRGMMRNMMRDMGPIHRLLLQHEKISGRVRIRGTGHAKSHAGNTPTGRLPSAGVNGDSPASG